MPDDRADLSLSRTFKFVNGVLSAADQAEQWAQVLSQHEGVAQPALSAGEIIDSKYRVLALVGAGGMGSVYRVQHVLLDKEMALKTFSAAKLTPDAWQRFQREAQAIAKLTHANIVQVFDFGIGQGNVPYYTMELLSGQSLDEKVTSLGRLSIEEALPLFAAAAAALSHAHKQGIVHRDVKPANIFLDQGKSGKSVVKVVDFGIAKLAASQNIEGDSQWDSGLVFGSPLYMSPEQSIGEPTDHRTDIYSYGCSLFEVLTGEPPFLGDNAFETISMRLNRVPPHLVDLAGGIQFSQSAEALVARLLAKDVAKRYQSFEEVLTDLAKVCPTAGAPAAPARATARQSKDKDRLLLESTQDNSWENIQGNAQGNSQRNTLGNTGPLFARRKQLAVLGSGAFCLVALALVVAYFSHITNNRSPTEREPLVVAPAPAPAETTARSYYSFSGSRGGRSFRFPHNTTMGRFIYGRDADLLARGLVTPPPGVRYFVPGEPLFNEPELFARFRPNDIESLNCGIKSALSWTDKHLDCITRHLTGLTDLDLTDSDIDGAAVVLLNRLKHLRALQVSETKITGRDLVGLERLRDLVLLEVTGLKDVRLMLDKLKGSNKLHFLEADFCGLADADMQTVATIPGLKNISFARSQISIVGLRYLNKLTEVERLAMGGVRLGPECIGCISAFKRLDELRFDMTGWSNPDKERLKKALLPQCKIVQDPEVAPKDQEQ